MAASYGMLGKKHFSKVKKDISKGMVLFHHEHYLHKPLDEHKQGYQKRYIYKVLPLEYKNENLSKAASCIGLCNPA
jgi:hypothetical protein